jgi:hypothetical protein
VKWVGEWDERGEMVGKGRRLVLVKYFNDSLTMQINHETIVFFNNKSLIGFRFEHSKTRRQGLETMTDTRGTFKLKSVDWNMLQTKISAPNISQSVHH